MRCSFILIVLLKYHNYIIGHLINTVFFYHLYHHSKLFQRLHSIYMFDRYYNLLLHQLLHYFWYKIKKHFLLMHYPELMQNDINHLRLEILSHIYYWYWLNLYVFLQFSLKFYKNSYQWILTLRVNIYNMLDDNDH